MKIKLLCVALGVVFATSAMSADMAKVVESCNGCHGKEGVSTDKDMPTVSGMSAKYLLSTYKAFKDKKRPCSEMKVPAGPQKGQKSDMCKAVAELSDAELQELAKMYEAKKFVAASQTVKADLVAKGQALHKEHCEKCHSQNGNKPGDNAGILAGQQMGYLAKTIEEYNTGKRPMEKKMKVKMEKVDAAGFEALVHFYGSLK